MEVQFNKEINGNGLFATKYYKKSEIVFTLSGEKFNKPTKYTIHIGNNIHIYDKNGIFINHSFTPTVYINNYDVIALVDIQINDEITFNYNDSEINMANPFIVNNNLVSGKII
jgi:hypothetical protein